MGLISTCLRKDQCKLTKNDHVCAAMNDCVLITVLFALGEIDMKGSVKLFWKSCAGPKP